MMIGEIKKQIETGQLSPFQIIGFF